MRIGLMNRADEIGRRPARIDAPLGSGPVLMFALNPVYRGRNFSEFRMLCNAMFSHKSLRLGPPTAKADEAAKDDDKAAQAGQP